MIIGEGLKVVQTEFADKRLLNGRMVAQDGYRR